MKSYILPNGLKIIESYQKRDSVAVHALVKAGSCQEQPKYYGAAHFVEHILFEGTKKRSALDIASAIEGVGGEIGAYTTNERTCYYIKSLARHLETSLDVLSDVLFNPLFDEKSIEKERSVIHSEVKMRLDEPRYHQWDIFLTTLFKSYPLGHPIIGTEETINNMSKDMLLNFYREYYRPDNMILVVSGGRKNIKEIIKKHFDLDSVKEDSVKEDSVKEEDNFCSYEIPFLSKKRVKKEKKDISQTYMMYGYRTVPQLHKDAVVLEVIRAILAKGMSGRLFDEIRNKRGLAYDLGAHHSPGKNYGFFCFYVSTSKRKISTCKSIMAHELEKIATVLDDELEEAKNYLEGEHIFENEDVQILADKLAIWDFAADISQFDSYIRDVRSVTKKDIKRVLKHYFSKPYAEIRIGK